MSRPLHMLVAAWPVKLFWALVLNAAFYVGYPFCQRHYVGTPLVIPPSAVDELIPFLPGTTALYLSLVLFLPLAPALMTRREELHRYGLASLAVTGIAFAFFLLFPTAIIRPALPSDAPLYRSLVAADLATNALPSLHAAYSVFTLVVLLRIFRAARFPAVLPAMAILWTLAILLSTLTTKQHAFLDIVAGTVLGGAGALLYPRLPGRCGL